MALFPGEDMVNVTTPDGRTLTLPRSLVPASMLPQQNIAPPPISPDVAGAPNAPPSEIALPPTPSVTNGALPTDMSQPIAPPAPQPDFVAATAQDLTKPGALEASNKAYDKRQAAQAAYAASPQGALAEGKAAIADEGRAAVKQADLDAAGQLVAADAFHKRNEELDQYFTQRQQQAQQDLADQQKKMSELETQRMKIANTKIDRSIDHPILAAIGVALAGLGSAMQHRYDGQSPDTTAINLVFKAVDRKVAGQMADLDQQKTVLGLTRDELATLKDKASSRLALNNLLIAGASEKAARQVEEITARTSSETMKAKGVQMAAQLRQRSAALSMDAAQAQMTYDQRDKFQRQEIGYKYSALGEQARQHNDEMQVKREEIAADMQKALGAANASGGAAKMKQEYELDQNNKKLGVWNVDTKDPLLKQSGVDKIKQADALEKQADSIEVSAGQGGKLPDTEKINALREQASQLRGDARLHDAFTFGDPAEAQKARDQYASAQDIVSRVDDIRLMYNDTGRSFLSTNDKRAAIQAKVSELMMSLKTAWQLGVLSANDTRIINTATGGDPTKGWNVGNVANAFGLDLGEDPEAFKARLGTLADDTASAVKNKFAVSGYDVKDANDMFARKTEPVETPGEKGYKQIEHDKAPLTVEEAQRNPGTAQKAAEALASWGGLIKPFTWKSAADATAESGSLQYPGLSKGQAAGFDTLITSYKNGNAQDGDLIVQSVLKTRDPDTAIALLHNLRDISPNDLYVRARQQLPDGPVAEQIGYEEKTSAGAALLPTGALIMQNNTAGGQSGDPKGWAELVRRATSGDKEAQKWAVDQAMNKTGKR